MAIDDVISDYETSVANAARVSLQPASGDEWLVTDWIMLGNPWNINPHTDTSVFRVGLWGGSTSSTDDFAAIAMHESRLLLTNSEYVRFLNSTGSTGNFGFSAIKTKD